MSVSKRSAISRTRSKPKDDRSEMERDLINLYGSDAKAMNALDGIVSDEAVTLRDVADCDLVRAWNWSRSKL